ncbi:efflux RND transporter permease subunit, partial [Salmonella enterica]|uniref:efflux RND transporter permease subunit n=1 Tax=Salmonella enterica TaxID=28901 RepID=UPI0014305D99
RLHTRFPADLTWEVKFDTTRFVAATIKEIGVSLALTLLAAFVPVALLPGIVGELYRQFAVTLSTAVALSSLVALTLTPARCALLRRPRPARPAEMWRAFNRLLDGSRDGYGRLVGWMNRRPGLALAATVAAGALVAFSFTSMPKGFLPQEDQG